MKIMVINGPNMNMLGIREKEIYGSETYAELVKEIKDFCCQNEIDVLCEQTNHEGVIIDLLQKAYFDGFDGVVLNAGGYTHTSVTIADAVRAIKPLPVIEVHISDIDKREKFRRHSLLKDCCLLSIKGKGYYGYIEAIQVLAEHINR